MFWSKGRFYPLSPPPLTPSSPHTHHTTPSHPTPPSTTTAFLEEEEEKDLSAEYMELVRSGFSMSEWMWEVVRRRRVLRQKGRGRKKKKRKRRKLPKSSSLQSSRGVRIRRCGQGSRSRSSLSGAQCSL